MTPRGNRLRKLDWMPWKTITIKERMSLALLVTTTSSTWRMRMRMTMSPARKGKAARRPVPSGNCAVSHQIGEAPRTLLGCWTRRNWTDYRLASQATSRRQRGHQRQAPPGSSAPSVETRPGTPARAVGRGTAAESVTRSTRKHDASNSRCRPSELGGSQGALCPKRSWHDLSLVHATIFLSPCTPG